MKKNILYTLFLVVVVTAIYSFVFSSNIGINKTGNILQITDNKIDTSFNESNTKHEVKYQITDFPAPKTACLACHNGIEPIREHGSGMAQEIYKKGETAGDPNGCVVCHKGNPSETKSKKLAHKDMIRYPASVWVYEQTCGQCHPDHTYAVSRSLMQTEAGKIQGALWGWGAISGYEVKYGNYNTNDPDGPVPIFGTEIYKKYMHRLAEKYPNNFPKNLQQLPEADVDNISEHPEQGVYTYLRAECLRCHVGVRGKQRRGDYRGMGCASCHIPFSDNGLYEGDDRTISKTKAGHLLVHSIQSSRKAKVKVHDKVYSGIPNETCSSCHNRGKRIGVSYLGMIESAYGTTWNADGSDQHKLHGKRYNYIKDDAHHNPDNGNGNPAGGLLCQDCHTTTSVHGNGNIGGTTLGEVETECADCHGTPEKYPWELPIGYGEEFGLQRDTKPRGVAKKLLSVQQKFSTIYPAEDGYILTARGNPYGNVVRRGDSVVVHSASGLDFKTPVLKILNDNDSWQNPQKAKTAMVNIGTHIDKMECYSCHSTWAPQCYGCHVKVDYSKECTSTDWLKTGDAHFPSGETAETAAGENLRLLQGKVTEGRSYVRWEDPVLGINGEGRVTPLIPGCQQITTVIDTDGSALFSNKIWRTPAEMENSDKQGQRGIDMTPVQPHTTSREARSCISCHANPKTLGYGINGGSYMKGYENDRYADLRNARGELLSENSTPQFSSINDLPFDLSQIVTRDGKQLQTVGHHWSLSSPLTQEQREKMERVGVCISCHSDIPNGSISMKMISSAGKLLDMNPHSDAEHSALINSDINWAATTRLLVPLLLLLAFAAWFFTRSRRRKRNRKY